jgi:nucleoside-diphosphate-sugar epimerase
MSANTMLVTGASGFLGGRVVEMLHLSGFAAPRAGVRRWSGCARIARIPTEVVMCDIMQPDQIAQAIQGANLVAHCAYTDTEETIVEGTRNMLEAAYNQGVDRFVFISTAEVYGDKVSGDIDESMPAQPSGWVYPDSKIKAEQLCLDYHAKGLPVTILRPSIVYGPFSETWITNYALRLLSGNWGVIKKYGEGFCNLIYVDDLVYAIFEAARNPNAVGQVFNVNGPDKITWNDYFRAFNAALGLPDLREIDPTQQRLKSTVMDFTRSSAVYVKNQFGPQIGKVARIFMSFEQREAMRQRMRRAKATVNTNPIRRDLDRLYSRQAYFVATKARDTMNFSPRFNAHAGLDLSIAWLKHHEIVN